MKSFPPCLHRLRDEDGAVTVDWVVLTAAVILLGGVAGGAVVIALPSLSARLGQTLGSHPVCPGN